VIDDDDDDDDDDGKVFDNPVVLPASTCAFNDR
jgi:hypothetical protein